MPTELLFKIFNFGVLLPWALLIFLPEWKGTQWMVKTKLPIIIIALAYLTVFLIDIFTTTGGLTDFTSFDSIKEAFGREEVVLVGWIHYLAFDLLIGMGESVDAQKKKIPHYLLVPCLVFTLMLGPIGWLLYWTVQKYWLWKNKKEHV